MESKKKFVFYYDNCSQPMIVYSGTPSEVILSTVKQVFKFKVNQDLLFLDEEGLPVVLSSFIPTETKLFIQKNQTETEKFEEEISKSTVENSSFIPKELSTSNINSSYVEQIPFKWLKPKNVSHQLKNNDLTVHQPVNLTQSHCFANISFSQGVHYYTILVDPLVCCVYSYISNKANNKDTLLDERKVTESKFPDVMGYDHNYELRKGVVVGHVVDMDKRKFVLVDHLKKEVKKKFDILDSEVSPVAYFKHEVSFTVLSYHKGTPDWLKY